MDRSRSKRFYNGNDDGYGYGNDTRPRTRMRDRFRSFSRSGHSFHHNDNYHRRSGDRKPFELDFTVTTSFKILCHDARAGGVIGKSGNIIRSIREQTGARVCMHDLVTGDEEHIIEITDTRTSYPEERMPVFSPAQEALNLVHDRILESYDSYGNGYGEATTNDGDYESRNGGRSKYSHHRNPIDRVVTRLVVPNSLVGSLMGRGGKIIEQMRITSKAHIRVLTKEHNLPRCVDASEEIVQISGGVNSVKDALKMISWRLRECQHRDQSEFRGIRSSESFPPCDDSFIPHRSSRRNSTSMDTEPRFSEGITSDRSNKYPSRSSGHVTESVNVPVTENAECFSGIELVFRILCPVEKLNDVVGESDGILKLLQNYIGVVVKLADQTAGSDEQIIIVSSDEGPDDELFPAQEALLHIQSRIFGFDSAKQKTITTRLLLKSDELDYMGGKYGLSLQMRNITGATVQILPKEERPVCASESDEILQIVGEIKAAREALIEVTSRLRSSMYGEFFPEETSNPCPSRSNMKAEDFDCNVTPPSVTYLESESTTSRHKISPNVGRNEPPKCLLLDLNSSAAEELDYPFDQESSGNEQIKPIENEVFDKSSTWNGIIVPLVTRSTLEIAIPPYVASKLITKSRNKVTQISEISGANVILVEEEGPEAAEKFVKISGTPEQAEKARNMLQGFILSTEEDTL